VTTTIGMFGAKGGIGKSIITLLMGTLLALKGKRVVVIDFDGNPGISPLFLTLAEVLKDREDLEQELLDNSMDLTVHRILLYPEKGIQDLILGYPLLELLDRLPTVRRDENMKVNPNTIRQETIEYYGIHPDTLQDGELHLIPNAGSFSDLLRELERRHLTDRTFNPEMALARNLPIALAAHYQAGYPEYDYVLIDTAGELGLLPTMVAHLADIAYFPFNMTALSLQGTIRTYQSVQSALRSEKVPHNLRIIPPLLNKYKSNRDKDGRWIQEVAGPKLSKAHLTISQPYLPYSSYVGEDADQYGIMPFMMNPLDPFVKATYEIMKGSLSL